MKSRIARTLAVVAIAAVMIFALVGWGTERTATVTAEPLSCYTEGGQVICFDGNPLGAFHCENTEEDIVLCMAAK